MTERPGGQVKRSLTIAGHRTSIALEPDFWSALEDMAHTRGLPLVALILEIDQTRGASNLTSALRVSVLRHFREAAGA